MTSENGGRARPHFKLYYFPVRNLAEVSRMILHYVNQPFDDIRVEMSEWPMLKPSKFYKYSAAIFYLSRFLLIIEPPKTFLKNVF